MSETNPTLNGKPPKSLRAKLRLVAIAFVSILFVIFAIVNAETVEVNLLFAQVSMPRFLLLIGVFGLGGVTGWLLRPRRRKTT
ncbi:MAG: putative integral membrane protein [Verrucomicrobiales bacterium]|jgi:uncharacterized integral membrane protein